MPDMRGVVRALIGAELDRQLGDQELEKRLEDLELDSMDMINMTIALEDRFGIEVSNREINQLMRGTGVELVNFVQSKVEERQRV